MTAALTRVRGDLDPVFGAAGLHGGSGLLRVLRQDDSSNLQRAAAERA